MWMSYHVKVVLHSQPAFTGYVPPTLQPIHPNINGGDGGGGAEEFRSDIFRELRGFLGGGWVYLIGGPGTVLPGIILWLIGSYINN